jgi:GH15 family glucan-1,4-alpha-glucosidase
MAYRPIQDYGMIGDMHTVALVGVDGGIDWLCVPDFDSPSVFAQILDDEKGGTFKIAPEGADFACKQFYWPETNVLVTRFLSAAGASELTDFMPAGRAVSGDGHHLQIIRRITAARGRVRVRMVCEPAFNYARDAHETHLREEGALFTSRDLTLRLATKVPLRRTDAGVEADFCLDEGETAVFVLRQLTSRTDNAATLSPEQAEDLFRRTVDYWRRWIGGCRYTGRWREMVHRSALALKLMTYEPTGAIVAAPTCSLPEGIGGERNWDYRYTWIRDSAFVIYAFLRLGFTKEAEAFMQFLSTLCTEPGPDGSLQIMYGIDGRKELREERLDHLDGYRGSKPVRIGNAAYDQLQLDIYGELMDAAYLHNKHAVPVSYDLWRSLRALVDWVFDNWRRPDEGVWEVRSGRRQFVYSNMMCWVALDRGIRLADKRSFPAPRERWLKARDEIYEDILRHGWSEKRQAFVQFYGGEVLDAANLMMPLTFFMAPNDPRMLSTLDATLRPPEHGGLTANSLVYRYNVSETGDGLSGEEGTFNICTFWLVEALTRAGRHDSKRLEDARLMFERMLGFANHVGLFAEQTGHGGEALGNFPQAFTHLAVISAAFNLDRALGPGA